MAQAPHAAMFDSEPAAQAAAQVRNALLVTFEGGAMENVDVEDWYRRDGAGKPMPAEWRDLLGQLHNMHHAQGGGIG